MKLPQSLSRVAVHVALMSISGVVSSASDLARASGFQPAYVVANVPVDATGDNGVAARTAARADGQARAFAALLKRITAPSDQTHLPSLSSTHVTDYVLDMEVKDEHVLPERYIGTYTFRFSPKGVLRLLRSTGVSPMDIPSKQIVVLPILQVNGTTLLWDDTNPWRQAWAEADARAGLVPWILPQGDLQDIQTLDPAAAINNPPPDRLGLFSQRYSGDDPVIASAVEIDRADGASLQITVTRYASGGPKTATASVDAAKPGKKLYAQGVQAALSALEDLWKQQEIATLPPGASAALTGDGAAQTVIVTAPIGGPHDWAVLRARLGQVAGVHGTQLVVLTHDEIKIALKLTGSPDSLRAAFAQQNLLLVPTGSGEKLSLQNGGSAAQ